MKLMVNGEVHEYGGDPEKTLSAFLREDLGLVSVKYGCSSQAACGGCSVNINAKASLSCITKMKKCADAEVITPEGLDEKVQHAFARAFVEKGGVQCGYCTPGIVMQANRLFEKDPNPDRQTIRKALNKNICRCTGYKKVIDSIEYAGEILRNEKEFSSGCSGGGIGKHWSKYEGYDRVLGKVPYVEDLRFEGMAHAALKFSDHPRATVVKLDVSKAQEYPGVLQVFRGSDIPGDKTIGLIVQDWPMMIEQGEMTHYVGDVLCGVVAETEKIAREAVELIEIEYEIHEPVSDVHEAMREDSPKIHGDTNILGVSEVLRGDVSQTLQNSKYVARGTYQTQCIEHAFLERECCIAKPWIREGEAGVEVFSQGQGIYEDRKQIAKLLNLKEELINVHQVSNGGGFGGKEDLTVQGHASLFAWKLGRPVKLCLSRSESMLMHPKRHPMHMEFTLGCDEEGKLTAIKADIIGDTGAYASVGMKVLERAVGHATGAYFVPQTHIRGTAVYTNNIPNGAMRGFGANQAIWALECCIEDLCKQGGFDPFEFRYRNALQDGDRTSTGQVIKAAAGVRACLDSLRAEYENARSRNLAVGLACGIKNCGVGNGMNDIGRARIIVESSQRVILQHGWTEMGQGVHNVAIQTLCEETGIDPSIVIIDNKTDDDLVTVMTTSSRATSLVGHGVIEACKELKKDLLTHSLGELEGKRYFGEWVCDWTTKPGKEKPGQEPVTHYSYSYAAQMVVLDEKGKIERIFAAHDGGKVICPTLFEGQVEGAVHMGLGYAVSEDFRQENSRPVHTKMGRLGIIRADQTPDVVVKVVEVPDPHGPYGAKGVGEIGLVPTAGAVTNALYHFDGIRRYELPLRVSSLLK